jgi:hypothetical protein
MGKLVKPFKLKDKPDPFPMVTIKASQQGQVVIYNTP